MAGDLHPGDNLYTTSTIALNPDTGQIVGHFQYHHNDSWDWDEVRPPILVNMQYNGQTIDGLVHPARDAYLWLLQQTDNGIKFLWAKPFVYQNAFTSIDSETEGRAMIRRTRRPMLPARWWISVPRCGAASIGFLPPTATRRTFSTSRPSTTCAAK